MKTIQTYQEFAVMLAAIFLSLCLLSGEPPRVVDHAGAPDRTTAADVPQGRGDHRHPDGAESTQGGFSPAYIEEANQFLLKHAPNRYNSLGLARNRPAIERMVARQYFELNNIRRQDPELYDLRVERMQIEDEIFGIARGNKPSELRTNQALTQKIGELVDVRMKIHAYKIKKLNSALGMEQKRLDSLKNKDRAIQRIRNMILQGRRHPGEVDDATIPSDTSQPIPSEP